MEVTGDGNLLAPDRVSLSLRAQTSSALVALVALAHQLSSTVIRIQQNPTHLSRRELQNEDHQKETPDTLETAICREETRVTWSLSQGLGWNLLQPRL